METMEVKIEEDTKEVLEEDMDLEEDKDMVVLEGDHMFYLILVKWAMSHDFVPNHMLTLSTLTVLSMSLSHICW
jgi:hypothetical protein